MIYLSVVLVAVLSLGLIKSAEVVIDKIRRLSSNSRASSFAISSLILAVGTSFPELFVGVTSALEGDPSLSLGVILGSNIANIALIGALSALISGRVHVYGDFLRRDVYIAFIAGIFPLFMISDGLLSRVDGLILLSIYLAYATGFFRKKYYAMTDEAEENLNFRFLRKAKPGNLPKMGDGAMLFIGIALMLFSADGIVKLSQSLALAFNVPVFLIGLFVIAIGTSLPEFAFSIKSLKEGEPGMFFGNILGSIIANSTLILGVTAVIYPIKVTAFNDYLVSMAAFVLIFSLFWTFIKTKHRLDRWEAAFLFLFYILFVAVEFAW